MSETLSTLRYLDVAEADELAAGLSDLAAWGAADETAKAAALAVASVDLDAGMPYQGRKFDVTQAREFPRSFDDLDSGAPASPSRVWDWDADLLAAVVPPDVKRAALYQADSILAGVREPRLSAQHDGVVYQQGEGNAESYKDTPGVGVRTGLCRRAWLVMRRYRLRSGRLV